MTGTSTTATPVATERTSLLLLVSNGTATNGTAIGDGKEEEDDHQHESGKMRLIYDDPSVKVAAAAVVAITQLLTLSLTHSFFLSLQTNRLEC